MLTKTAGELSLSPVPLFEEAGRAWITDLEVEGDVQGDEPWVAH